MPRPLNPFKRRRHRTLGALLAALVVTSGMTSTSCKGTKTGPDVFLAQADGIVYRLTLSPSGHFGRLALRSKRNEPVRIDKFKYDYCVTLRRGDRVWAFPDPAVNVRGPVGDEWVVLTKDDEISWTLDFANGDEADGAREGTARLEHASPTKSVPDHLRPPTPVLHPNALDLRLGD